jgi:TPR repeat protein
MIRACPSCKSLNARRSTVRASEITMRHIFLSPYRCRDCRERFWVISRNTYYLAGIIGVAIAIGAVGWHLGALLEAPHADQALPGADESRLVDLRKLAEGNDAAAEHELARMYGNGLGTPKSPAEEHNWLQRSARHGNVLAQYELGIALRDGRGTIQDYEEALKWLQKAAEGGNADAQFALGQMHRTGMGTPIDHVKAYVWLNVAAAQGVPGAASARDTVLARLSAAELAEGQAEARRYSTMYIRPPASAN